jgi:hypothetical protein
MLRYSNKMLYYIVVTTFNKDIDCYKQVLSQFQIISRFEFFYIHLVVYLDIIYV